MGLFRFRDKTMGKQNKLAIRKTAVLIDGAFFIKRYRALYPDWDSKTSKEIVRSLIAGIMSDLRKINRHSRFEIYRIFYYDCPPLNKRLENPVTKIGFNTIRSNEAVFRLALFEELKKSRKVALRLGSLSENGAWIIKPDIGKKLINKKITVDDLTAESVHYEAPQKGVDMKIGVDIASLAYKQHIDQILLIAGDTDFVPAAKLARREGIDFILDPMWNPINPALHEHIDGLQSCWDKPEHLHSDGAGAG